MRRRHGIRVVVVATAAALTVLAAAPAALANFPLLTVAANNHQLGGVDDLEFGASYLSSGGEAQALEITTPSAYNASITKAVGTKLGGAVVGIQTTARNASITRYSGSLLVMDPAAYATDANAQACAPGPHTAVWYLDVVNVPAGEITIPIAVDAAGGGYAMTMCFGAVQALGRVTEYLYFQPSGIFRNPSKPGTYLFHATVTPFASGTTTGNAGSAYELRAYEIVPQTLEIVPAFDPDKKQLVVGGVLTADGKPRAAVGMRVYGAATSDAARWTDLGSAVTKKDGSFVFTKKLAKLTYPYVYASALGSNGATCAGSSAAPGGCASESFDWRASTATKVATYTLLKDRPAPPELRNVLLKPVELSSVKGSPSSGFVSVPLQKAGISENTDPRTACGGKLPSFPNLRTGAIAFFANPSIESVLQWVNRLKPGLAPSLMSAEVKGARPGCAGFTTPDSLDVETASKLAGVVQLPSSTGDKRLAVVLRLTQGKQSVYFTKIIMQRGPFLMLTELLTRGSPSHAFVQQLALAAGKRFDTLPAT